MNVSVCGDDSVAVGSSYGIGRSECEGISIYFGGKCSIAKAAFKFPREGLRPDSTRNGVTEGRTNEIGGKVKTSNDGKMLVSGSNLDGCLCRIGEKTASNSKEDLATDEASMTIGTATEMNQNTEGNDPNEGAKDTS